MFIEIIFIIVVWEEAHQITNFETVFCQREQIAHVIIQSARQGVICKRPRNWLQRLQSRLITWLGRPTNSLSLSFTAIVIERRLKVSSQCGSRESGIVRLLFTSRLVCAQNVIQKLFSRFCTWDHRSQFQMYTHKAAAPFCLFSAFSRIPQNCRAWNSQLASQQAPQNFLHTVTYFLPRARCTYLLANVCRLFVPEGKSWTLFFIGDIVEKHRRERIF